MMNQMNYEAWETLDQAVLQFIHSNIKSERLMQIPGGVESNQWFKHPILITSSEFWENVCDKHETYILMNWRFCGRHLQTMI